MAIARPPSSRRDMLDAFEAGVSLGPDPAARDAVARFGRPALAWEILRRDPRYRADADGERSAHGLGAASAAFVARWGLHFR